MKFPPLFSFTGRVSRGSIWLLMLAAIVILVPINLVIYFVMQGLSDQDGNLSMGPLTLSLLAIAYACIYVVVGIIGVAFQVRRCHDRDRSGWFILLWLLPILNIWGFIEMYLLAGTTGSNRFGPDPLRRDMASTAAAFS